jgi:prolyl oligopeptidase
MEAKDTFRPLENDTSAQTAKWVNEENALTQAYLEKIPFRKDINKRLTSLNNFSKKGIPSKHTDGYYYFYENNGLQNQSVLYRTKDISADSAEAPGILLSGGRSPG